MKSPLIVDYRGDIVVFERVEDAESYVEFIDLANGDAVAYDSEGRLLRGSLTRKRFWQSKVKFADAEDQPKHASILRDLLIKFLSAIGDQEASSLEEALQTILVRVVAKRAK